MSHLGERLTALVDGELGHDDRDRALAHLALCGECRAAAEALRRVKKRLRALADAPPIGFEEYTPELPSADFMARLQAIKAGSPPDDHDLPGPPSGRFPARGSRLTGPFATPPRDSRPGGRSGHAAAVALGGMPRRYLAAGAAVAVLGLGTATFLAGGDHRQAPQVTPAFEHFAVEHALTSGEMPVNEPSARP